MAKAKSLRNHTLTEREKQAIELVEVQRKIEALEREKRQLLEVLNLDDENRPQPPKSRDRRRGRKRHG